MARVNGPSWRVTGFHYPSTRVDGRTFPLAELTGRVTRQLGPLTRAVNSSSGNRALRSKDKDLKSKDKDKDL